LPFITRLAFGGLGAEDLVNQFAPPRQQLLHLLDLGR
jgi:hypothetical protein